MARERSETAPRRRGRRLAAVGAVLALAVGVLAGCGSSGPTVPPTPGPSVGTSLNGPVAPNILNMPLTTADGTTTTLAAMRGKVVVISDIMTLCQETCPLDTANLVAAARATEAAGLGDKVVFASITIDPDRDTPVQMAAYRQLFAPAPADWTALTGNDADLAALWKYLGVYSEKVPEGNPPSTNWRTGQVLTYDLNHSDEVFFIDPSGNERFVLDGYGSVAPGTGVPAPLATYMDAQGTLNLQHPDASQSWTVPQALQVVSWLTGHTIQQPTR